MRKINIKMSVLMFITLATIIIILSQATKGWKLSLLLISSVLLLILYILFIIQYFLDLKKKKMENIALSYKVEGVGREAFDNLPIGIISYNNFHQIEWSNSFAKTLIPKLYNKEHLKDILNGAIYEKISNKASYKVNINNTDTTLKVISIADKRVVYFFDNTIHEKLVEKYLKRRPIIGMMQLDNYQEMLSTFTETEKAKIKNQIVTVISEWAEEHKIFLKNIESDRYMLLFENEILEELIKNNFDILNKVRKKGEELDIPITLSIGLAKTEGSLIDVGNESNTALDFAVSRGGDQVALKNNDRPYRFFGGRTESFAKRNRTRTRLLADNLAKIINKFDKVLIMPHKNPDADALGAAIGIAKFAKAEEKDFKIVFSKNEITDTTDKMIKYGQGEQGNVFDSLIEGSEAIEYVDDETLLVVVDTHNQKMVVEPEVVAKASEIVVIDHHRRGKDYINNTALLHQEPYASSTVELVVELVEYYPKKVNFTAIEATLLLTGIIVDTKSFTFRTGARTFEAASVLRKSGADMIKVQMLLRDDVEQFKSRAKIVKNITMIKKDYAVVKTPENLEVNRILLAQSADSVLMVDGVKASFALGKIGEEIAISARSLGEVNVQLVMEKLGGGGHLNNAATTIKDKTIEEAYQMLVKALHEYKQED